MDSSAHLLSNDQLIEVFNYTKTATAVHVGEDAVIQTANDAMLKIWGKDKSIIGKSLQDALPELVGQPFIAMFARVWNEGLILSGSDTAADLEIDGVMQTFYFNFEYRAIKDTNGQTICVLHTAIDVTEQVTNRLALQKAAEHEQLLIAEQALNTQLATANEELSATNEELFQSQEELNSTNEQLEKRIESRLKDLSESEARFKTMAESTEMLISVSDENSKFTYVNKAWAKLTGVPVEELQNDGWAALIHPDERDSWTDTYRNALARQISFEGELRIKSKDGSYQWLLVKAPPRFRPDGSFAGYVSSCMDITDRKLDELEKLKLANELAAINEEMTASNEELQTANEELVTAQDYLQLTFAKLSKSENRTRQLITAAPIAIAVLNTRELLIESANEKMLEIWNNDITIVGSPLSSILKGTENENVLELLDTVFTTGKAKYGIESPATLSHREEHQEVYFNYVFQPMPDETGYTATILITATDVTEQVNARKKVEEAEIALRLAIEAANFGTWHIHSVTRKFITSDRLKELFGFYPEDDITIEDAISQITPDYRTYVSTSLEKALSGNGDYDVSYPVLGFHDHKIRWLRAIGNLQADPSGEFSAFTGVVMDISESKRDEERKNDFIGMVSHELKTPLTSLKGYIQILQMTATKGNHTFMSGALEKADRQIKKMTSMINGFLNISRLESGKIILNKSTFKLNELLNSLVEEAVLLDGSHLITYGILEEVEIFADQDKIGNVVSNLLSNAVKYSPVNKDIVVNCSIIDGMAQISIKDHGMGIAAQDIDKLFERYYRVQSNHNISGFGIGLYLSAEIVARHEGQIWVESELDQGATFYFTLPLKG